MKPSLELKGSQKANGFFLKGHLPVWCAAGFTYVMVSNTRQGYKRFRQSYSGLRSPDDQTQPPFEMTPGFKPFTVLYIVIYISLINPQGWYLQFKWNVNSRILLHCKLLAHECSMVALLIQNSGSVKNDTEIAYLWYPGHRCRWDGWDTGRISLIFCQCVAIKAASFELKSTKLTNEKLQNKFTQTNKKSRQERWEIPQIPKGGGSEIENRRHFFPSHSTPAARACRRASYKLQRELYVFTKRSKPSQWTWLLWPEIPSKTRRVSNCRLRSLLLWKTTASRNKCKEWFFGAQILQN